MHIWKTITAALLSVIMMTAVSCEQSEEREYPTFASNNDCSMQVFYDSYETVQGDVVIYSRGRDLRAYSLTTGETYSLAKVPRRWYNFESGCGYKTIVGNDIYFITFSTFWPGPLGMYHYSMETGKAKELRVVGVDINFDGCMATEDNLYIWAKNGAVYRYNLRTEVNYLVANLSDNGYSYNTFLMCWAKDAMFFYDPESSAIYRMSLPDGKVSEIWKNDGTHEVSCLLYDSGSLYLWSVSALERLDLSNGELTTVLTPGISDGDGVLYPHIFIRGNTMVQSISHYGKDTQSVEITDLTTGKVKVIAKKDDFKTNLSANVQNDKIFVSNDGKTEIYDLSGNLLVTLPDE